MIPKTIHYVWLGNKPKPKKIKKCIASWKHLCPDYKIIEWNESNFDLHSHPFLEEAYEAKNFAFCSDIIRLMVLYDYGGIYVDADVEFIKPIDDLLCNEAFVGFEMNQYVNSGQMLATIPHNKIIKEHLEQYDGLSFSSCEDINKIACPVLLANLLQSKGLELNGKEQVIEGLRVFPQDYFNPYDTLTGVMNKTENTYSIHWSARSWVSINPVTRGFVQICHRIFGISCFEWLNKILGR